MVSLFQMIFGVDYLSYVYTTDQGMKIAKDCDPRQLYQYDHQSWEEGFDAEFKLQMSKIDSVQLSRGSNTARKADILKEYLDEDDLRDGDDDLDDIIPLENDEVKPPECKTTSTTTSDTRNLSTQPQQSHAGLSSFHSIIPDFSSGRALPLSGQLLVSQTATRAELASINIPPVGRQSQNVDLQRLFHVTQDKLTDVLALTKRPSEAVVTKAERLIAQRGPAGQKPVAINIKDQGLFNHEGIKYLTKLCKLSSLRRDVIGEINWLDHPDGLSDIEQHQLGINLWHRSPSYVISREDGKIIDVEAFTTLAMERYLDNMTIDVCISKYASGSHFSLYLPFEVWTWLTALKHEQLCQRFSAQLLHKDGNTLEQVLALVHFSTFAHWGLLFIDLRAEQLYFDDGHHCPPEPFVIEGAKKMLDILCHMFPKNIHLQSSFWSNLNDNDISRFGMDNQVVSAARNGQGSGSCGVGVILAARDIIALGSQAVNNLTWKYGDMRKLRKKLMLDIIQWG